MQISFELNEKDFVQAYITHRERTPFGKWVNRILLWLVLLFMVSIIVGLILNIDGPRVAKEYLPLSCLAFFWILVLEAWPHWAMKRQFRKQPGAHGPRTLTLDADGTHWRWDGGSSDVAWRNHICWVEGRSQILFYTSPTGFNMLPKRALQPTQLAQLRELLKQHISAK